MPHMDYILLINHYIHTVPSQSVYFPYMHPIEFELVRDLPALCVLCCSTNWPVAGTK